MQPPTTLTRRALIAGAGTAVASAALAVPYVNAAHSEPVCSLPLSAPVHDPLLHAVRAYQSGLDDFNRATGLSDEERDEFAKVSYAPPMAVLTDWTEPARSMQGAVEALRLAAEENADFGDELAGSMISAALAYLETTLA